MNEEEIARVAEKVLKGRRYVDDPDEAPEDAEVQEGERGGYYYQVDGGDGDDDSVVDPDRVNLTRDEVDFDDLQVGDVLYMDRGYVEEVKTIVDVDNEYGDEGEYRYAYEEGGGLSEGGYEVPDEVVINPEEEVDVETDDEADEEEESPDGEDEESTTPTENPEVRDYDSTSERDEIGDTPGVLTENWDSVETAEDLEDALENPESMFREAEINGVGERQAKDWADAFQKIDNVGAFGEIGNVTTEGTPDGDEAGYWDEDRNELYLDPDYVYDERSVMDFESGHKSSPHPAATAVHEAGHAMHYEQASSRNQERKMALSPDESVADEVSERAKASRGEFVAEVFAGIVAGGMDGEPREFSEEVMELYDEYNGPPIPEEYL